jgi:putative spermidine/putrescine transport system permease protein
MAQGSGPFDGRRALNAAANTMVRGSILRGISTFLSRHPTSFLVLLLAPPLIWLGVVYLGSLCMLLVQSIFSIDDFSGTIIYEPTFKTLLELFQPANLDVIKRSLIMASAVTIASAIIAYPLCYFAARYAKGKWKALFYLLVMLPLWSSYLVKVYAWKLILAKEGIVSWTATQLHLTWLLEGILALPVVGGPSLSISYIVTFIVFVYIWLPYMILPTQAALERVPANVIEASSDLGARPRQTFQHVIWPLALPGLIAGSIFTFSLTLGDYIIPQIVGSSTYFLGQAVYTLQGTAGNVPLAAAFTLVPIGIMMIYLSVAKRMGAFDAL